MVWVVRKFSFTVDAPLLLVFLLLLILFFLLVFLWNDVVQVAEVVLGEHVVHGLAHCNQGQDHDREDDGRHGGLEDPEQGQTKALDEGEEVDASLGDVAQVDQVRLVLGGHQHQQQAVHELDTVERRHSHIEEHAIEHRHGDELEDRGHEDGESCEQEHKDPGDSLLPDTKEFRLLSGG